MRALNLSTRRSYRNLMMLDRLIERQTASLESIAAHLASIEAKLERLANTLDDHIGHSTPPF